MLPAFVFVLTIADDWLVTLMKDARGDGQTLTILTHICAHTILLFSCIKLNNALIRLIVVVIQFPDIYIYILCSSFFLLFYYNSSSLQSQPYIYMYGISIYYGWPIVYKYIVIVIALLSSSLFVTIQ